MRNPISAIAAVLMVALHGCSSLSERECQVSDWHAIGYEDGVRGYSAGRVSEYRKACSKHGVAPDLAAYQLGRRDGLEDFCRSENAFQLGAAGDAYRGVCPDELAADFSTAFFQGRRLYDLEADVRSAKNRISAKDKRLKTIDQTLAANAAHIVDRQTATEQRVRLLAESRSLLAERELVEADIERLKRERRRRQRELEAFRSELAGIY